MTTNPWHGSGNGVNQWIVFDFKIPTYISGFRYKAAGGSPQGMHGSSFKNFRFEHFAGWNGAFMTWKSFYTGKGDNLDCCEWKTIDFGFAKRSRYFRLYMIDNWGYNWLSIGQLQIKTGGDCNANGKFKF